MLNLNAFLPANDLLLSQVTMERGPSPPMPAASCEVDLVLSSAGILRRVRADDKPNNALLLVVEVLFSASGRRNCIGTMRTGGDSH